MSFLMLVQLVTRKSDDGLAEAKEGVPLGKRYLVDLDTLRSERFWNTNKRVTHTKDIVNTVDQMTGRLGAYIFFDLVEFVE